MRCSSPLGTVLRRTSRRGRSARESVDSFGHRAACRFGVVVFGTQVAEPNAACLGREVLFQSFGREAVVHVSASAGDAFAQVKRIRAVVEEFAVVVGFDHEVAGSLHS